LINAWKKKERSSVIRMGLIQPFNYLTYTATPALGVTAQAGKRHILYLALVLPLLASF
jgi:hypothetical protein